MTAPSRTHKEFRDAHRAFHMTALAICMGTSDLRKRLGWVCLQAKPDRTFLSELLRVSAKLNDPSTHARILRDLVDPAPLTDELEHDIFVKERFGIAGARLHTMAAEGTAVLYGPIRRDDGEEQVLVATEQEQASMVCRCHGEVRTSAKAVLRLLFDQWARTGLPGTRIRGFIQEMGMSTISELEREFDDELSRAVAVSDDYDVSVTLDVDAVIVCTKDAAILYEDPAVFREQKIRLVADPNRGVLMPGLDDKILARLLDFVGKSDGARAEEGQMLGLAVGNDAHDMMCEETGLPLNFVGGLNEAARETSPPRILITHHRYCPDPLPPGGEKLTFD